MAHTNGNGTSDFQKLQDLIKDIKVAMLTTTDADGTMRSRPMWTLDQEFTGKLWFFTSQDSPKHEEIEHDMRVNLSYANSDDNKYVSVSGLARFRKDPALIDKFWKDIYKAWFPEGKSDPKLIVLEVSVEKAEFWDSPSSTVAQAIGFAKALVTGKKYEPSDDEHGKVNLS